MGRALNTEKFRTEQFQEKHFKEVDALAAKDGQFLWETKKSYCYPLNR